MKKFLVLLFLATVLPSFTVPGTAFSIVGKWKSVDKKGNVAFMFFDKEGYVSMGSGDKLLGGKEFEMNGEKGRMTYVVDYPKNMLDLVITRIATKEQKKLLGIYKIINANEILLVMQPDKRPVSLTGPDALTFKRVPQK